jgi:hypothetical protein
MRFMPGMARFVASAVFPGAAMRLIVARTTSNVLLLVARRLDAAEGAAKLVNLPLVGQFLALGQLDQFENFVQLINGVLERLGDFRGMRDGLADG